MTRETEIKAIYKKIQCLNQTLWEHRVLKPNIDNWLTNFETEEEKQEALFLLSQFMYFGSHNIRTLLRVLYRDSFRYPIIRQIRQENGDTLDPLVIEPLFEQEKKQTLFMGVGNPSESGVHLLYYFRQENELSKDRFVNTDDIIVRGSSSSVLRHKSIKRYVFIDDFCGSGSQATTDTNVNRCVSDIRSLNKDAEIFYLMLFGTSKGVKVVRDSGLYDYVNCVIELDENHKCFSSGSRIFSQPTTFDAKSIKSMCIKYGAPIMKEFFTHLGWDEPNAIINGNINALGYGDCQLLIGFHHNVPDNSLPIIWYNETGTVKWIPIFKRYSKKYGDS